MKKGLLGILCLTALLVMPAWAKRCGPCERPCGTKSCGAKPCGKPCGAGAPCAAPCKKPCGPIMEDCCEDQTVCCEQEVPVQLYRPITTCTTRHVGKTQSRCPDVADLTCPAGTEETCSSKTMSKRGRRNRGGSHRKAKAAPMSDEEITGSASAEAASAE